jgi:hypothetical protein
MLDATGVNPTLLEDILMLRGKVFAYDSYDSDFAEIAGSEGEVGAGAAENVLGAPGRSGDRIKRNRTYRNNAHYSPDSQT